MRVVSKVNSATKESAWKRRFISPARLFQDPVRRPWRLCADDVAAEPPSRPSASSSSRQRTPAAEAQLWAAIRALEPLLPDYVSVTYGGGGGTRDKTYETVTRIFAETHLRPAAHLTCVGQSRTEIEDLLNLPLGGGRPAYRGPARRPAHRRPISAASRRFRQRAPSWWPGSSAWRISEISVVGLSRNPSTGEFAAIGSRQPQVQVRRRRRPRHHAVLLRQSGVISISWIAPPRPVSTARSSLASCLSRNSRR